ncbi:cobyric acid synthase [Thermococcus kodakarensis KOD1]|uniref:Probable cobyric acid synthase n=1 Tax=Thermococcus kodakarensis (strain ATCC BAA-918 / JCM 12380 / KOD1) TaxID=69014 RepID=COBQ_THEKO|nr:cobyric acid synthase [Thermococcus kodakarensis]O33475.2 RecName: Full=Probable cobyric acid synthase [Thermococcus kodakarensis KOD1]WCN28857.1 cobyric acid synthase [Thermococcus kodakarensis]WCN31159.1 cobyric acid synthase [Thermococcus kodakarensis]BAD85043.1 cobyric acid synthase [Thermococcus kodakarensis KOD1]
MGKALMVQGTMSGAGKSLLVAALCRIFTNLGYDVVPFKSQNMSLNSAPSIEGGEISRAQYLQALACRKKPSVKFNPILLKPEGNMRSQVVFMGRPIGSVSARDYMLSKKAELFEKAIEVLKELMREHDLVIIEGAGSPVEINLKDYDIANMRVAKAVNAPVILVADIDRGGSFAQIVGTMELLSEEERELVMGFIFNKFRGDASLLKPGFEFLEKRCGKPVLGVVPYIEHRLPEEDSLAEFPKVRGDLHIQIIKLPHISNFTDFEPLHWANGVDYVTRAEEIKGDLIIVPGSKNTVEDLLWMRENGIEDAIIEAHREGSFVVGICGGFQMLGKEIIDEVESKRGRVEGIGLLPAKTVFTGEKRTNHLKAEVLWEPARGMWVEGYEIRMGRSTSEKPFSVITSINGARAFEPEGAIGKRAFGTYLHGIFHNFAFTERFLNMLRAEKGLEPVKVEEWSIEEEIEKFTRVVRESVDVEYIIQRLGL